MLLVDDSPETLAAALADGRLEIAVEAMKEGLDDHITKTPKHSPRIGYAVRACLDNVAQHARAERAQARLEIALQSAGMATWQFDPRDRTIVASGDLGPMLGQPPGHAPATVDAWLADIHDDDRPRVIDAWKAAFAGTGDYRMQYRVRGADGKPPMVIGTAREVTADIETRQNLERKTELLEKADRQKNEFLAILAHELRNPLGAARYSIALLRQAPDNESVRTRATGVIDRQIGHMAKMLDELLDLSRIAHNRIELERAPDRRTRLRERAIRVRGQGP
ncbi:hypothetical protein IA69_24825 [Massilia sp. JS1662]|nr:histidine kinase dimerization/phospho-acceptor domain-containing protein [Massilia sp. JS1662]KGF79391.1 hypothetical protein IA69_24825 [Massilia sp. JS1662]